RRASMILVPTDRPGYELVRKIPVMGHRGRGWTTHCEVTYENVRVPVENVLGEPGDGFRIAQKRLGPGRIHHVMRWLGQMQRAFDLMCGRALEREAFGGPLAGLTDRTPLAGMLAMARGGRIYDGPDEVHRMVVSRRILKEYAAGGTWHFR